MPRIDFNCDVGEGCGDDAAILPWVTSANIACGAHAGDAATMRATLRLCRTLGVVAGAHPGYPDRDHFGRRELPLEPDAITALVRAQVEALAAIAREEGVVLRHVKPHGALYNRSARDPAVADAIARAVAGVDPSLVLVGLSGSCSLDAAEAHGLATAHEVFAERGYDASGRLLPRGTPGAVIEALPEATAQALALARGEPLAVADGQVLRLRADTLCLHGDRADAAIFARALRGALDAAGITVASLAARA